ncbi:MAG: (2Fe-2S)-binding protein [Synergistaceae bacterium]|nr:(2Fe-2S)-binding protein [Synergistaceae bacterium]
MRKGIFSVNGRREEWTYHDDDVLLDSIREAGHTEVHRGCKEGGCGCCAVLLEGVLVNSCQVFTASAEGRDITTVAGLGTIHDPHPLQQAFVETGAVQCGFCTPAMILSSYALLQKNPNPSDEEIRRGLDGNSCRCTGYVKIIEAVRLAAGRMAAHDE